MINSIKDKNTILQIIPFFTKLFIKYNKLNIGKEKHHKIFKID